MKTPKKSKPTTKPTDNQLSLDYLADRVSALGRTVDRIDAQLDALSRAVVPAASVPKPPLKWFEQEPQPIEWCVCCDPARLILTPGTTLRYNIEDEVITTYDNVTIGELNAIGHNIISNAVKQGDKVHVYLTTARKLGIKLGK
jgi:hypothetical protein